MPEPCAQTAARLRPDPSASPGEDKAVVGETSSPGCNFRKFGEDGCGVGMLAFPSSPYQGAIRHVLLVELVSQARIAPHLTLARRLNTVGACVDGQWSGDADIQGMGVVPWPRCREHVSRPEARSAGKESQRLWFGGRICNFGKFEQSTSNIAVALCALAWSAT